MEKDSEFSDYIFMFVGDGANTIYTPCAVCASVLLRIYITMSAEATRLLTHRRTRFRSNTSSERGDVADVLDLAQHVYPTAATRPAAAMPCTADKTEERELHPAGLVALGFALLFLGLHHWLCTYVLYSPGGRRGGGRGCSSYTFARNHMF